MVEILGDILGEMVEVNHFISNHFILVRFTVDLESILFFFLLLLSVRVFDLWLLSYLLSGFDVVLFAHGSRE